MTKQSEIFLEGEAEQWFARNQAKLPVKDDPVMEIIEDSKVTPGIVLEVGCSNGWRVKAMQSKWGCKAYGIDPFFRTQIWDCRQGTADNLGMYRDAMFDMVIYGWCLYLCDREDLFKIVTEGDRVLKDGGHIVVYDFHTSKPHKRVYKHKDDVFSFKMDYATLWSANPTYKLQNRRLYGNGEDQTSVTILRKQLDKGWPTL